MLALILTTLLTTQTIDILKAPPILEVHRMAINHSQLDFNKTEKWKRNSKLQALLPRLQVEYERHVRDNIDIDINDSVYVGSGGVNVGPEENSYSRDAQGDQNVAIKAIWMLNELVFNRDELDISAESRSIHRERQILLAEVNISYFKWVRIADQLGKTFDLKQKNTKQRELEEMSANLDALTGGWFSKNLR